MEETKTVFVCGDAKKFEGRGLTNTLIFGAMFANYLNEKEIQETLEKFKERCPNIEYGSAVRSLVAQRHFSEDFLMENIEYLSKEDILKLHSADLLSNEYSSLKLYYEVHDKDKK